MLCAQRTRLALGTAFISRVRARGTLHARLSALLRERATRATHARLIAKTGVCACRARTAVGSAAAVGIVARLALAAESLRPEIVVVSRLARHAAIVIVALTGRALYVRKQDSLT